MGPTKESMCYIRQAWVPLASLNDQVVLILETLVWKAYETIRDSGCIYLPSQRTLRDNYHCVRASAGYLSDVDLQLVGAVQHTIVSRMA